MDDATASSAVDTADAPVRQRPSQSQHLDHTEHQSIAGGLPQNQRRSRKPRPVVAIVVAVVLLIVAAAMSLWIGTRWTSPNEVWTALMNGRGHGGNIGIIVWDQRLPRTMMAIVVGAALAVSAALVQGLTGNPLGDPGVLGVSGGAAFFAVLATMALGVQSVTGYMWFALIGAIIAASAVFSIASLGGGGSNPMSLILAGAALSALCVAGTTAVILHSRVSLNQYRFWVVGSLVERNFGVLAAIAPIVIVGIVLALACSPSLNALAAGADVATALGVRVNLVRAASFIALTMLAAGATAAAGPIAFAGLVVPHIMRYFTGPDHRWLIPACIPAGAVLTIFADVLGRIVLRPSEVAVGIMMSFIGVPVYVYIVRRRKVVRL